MVTTEILNPHSEVELEKAIKLEAVWFGSEAAETAALAVLQSHCHHMKSLQRDIMKERILNRTLRKDAKGVEIKVPLARSWHK